ncbi:MAG: Hsp20 family protein [Zoogloeaceae bacterium]|nr:Hsp20 family protein [Zoogloeaceae bacterium]MCP5294314.1 Hsp20 family protein [Zoogloeaceae bacterium]MCW5614881.1 Hsp20 family protein [Rhodocyclaceae bacterium]
MNNLVRNDPLDDFFRGFFVRPVEFGQGGEAPAIKVDIKENAEGYAIHAELPGVRKEDIHVSIDGPVVSISAERQEQKEVKEGERILRTERRFGKVSRSFQLGQELDESRASAKYSDGVLELSLPRKEAVQAKRLTIE